MESTDIINQLYKFYDIVPSNGKKIDYISEISRSLIKSVNAENSKRLESLVDSLKSDFLEVKNDTKRNDISYKVLVYDNDLNDISYKIELFISKLLTYYTIKFTELKKNNHTSNLDLYDSHLNDILYLTSKYKDELEFINLIPKDKRSDFFRNFANRNKLIEDLEQLVINYGSEVGITLLDFRISKFYLSLISYKSSDINTFLITDKYRLFVINKIKYIVENIYSSSYIEENILNTSVTINNRGDCIIFDLLF